MALSSKKLWLWLQGASSHSFAWSVKETGRLGSLWDRILWPSAFLYCAYAYCSAWEEYCWSELNCAYAYLRLFLLLKSPLSEWTSRSYFVDQELFSWGRSPRYLVLSSIWEPLSLTLYPPAVSSSHFTQCCGSFWPSLNTSHRFLQLCA